MRKEVASETSDFLDALLIDGRLPAVEVMTPERLSSQLRADSQSVLDRFGLFIFDEAHNVGGDRRGWTLEAALTYLHHATQLTEHRIALISAAVGNRGHFISWLKRGETGPSRHTSDRRGPRRVHCVWTTYAAWDQGVVTPGASKKYPFIETVPIWGLLNTRLTSATTPHTLRSTNPVGELTFYLNAKRTRVKPKSRTPGYRSLLPLITHLGSGGPVLIVEATRPQTVQTARALAQFVGDLPDSESDPLQSLVRLRLGDEHPLASILRAGVAYHHGSLPQEIRTAIEDAIAEGRLQYLVATTTMTEGVNLPVRSVVVAATGSYSKGSEFQEYIRGAKLVNAIGRAGRAAKETEGIIVLSRQSEYSSSHFQLLEPDEDETTALSWLATSNALSELADFEAVQLAAQDAVLEFDGEHVSSFLSFIWFVSAELERLATPVTEAAVAAVMERSLAWVQLDEDGRVRWRDVINKAIPAYLAVPVSTRRRWARSDRPIPAATRIETLARRLTDDVRQGSATDHDGGVFAALVRMGAFDVLLGLPDAPKRRVFDTRSGSNRENVTPRVLDVLGDWIEGKELVEIANVHFARVTDPDYRFEQLGDFLNDYFEVFLPAAVATLLAWTNEILRETADDADETELWETDLPAFIRWGVNDPVAAKIMAGGLGSRRLAMRIAASLEREDTHGSIREWLGLLPLADLRARFEPSDPELKGLLEYVRNRSGSPAAVLLDGDVFSVTLQTVRPFNDRELTSCRLAFGPGEADPMEVVSETARIGSIPSGLHADLYALVAAGLSCQVTARREGAKTVLELRVIEPREDEVR